MHTKRENVVSKPVIGCTTKSAETETKGFLLKIGKIASAIPIKPAKQKKRNIC